MRSLISCLAVAICLAAIVATAPASAGVFGRQSADNGQCANGQCANGQCACGNHRKPIDVAPEKPAAEKPAEKKPAANDGEKAAFLGLVFLLTVTGVGAYLFHQRVNSRTATS